MDISRAKQHPWWCLRLEIVLCISLCLLSALHYAYPDYQHALKQLYFAPIIISALMLGWRRTSAFTVVGVCLVLCLEETLHEKMSASKTIDLIIWASILGTTSALIGYISSRSRTELTELVNQQKQLALTDSLTNVANRRAFEIEMKKLLALCERQTQRLSLLVVDIDHFKKFNDTFGHEAGDHVLEMVAASMNNLLRESDMVSRYGGEEFVITLPGTALENAQMVAERMRESVAKLQFQMPKIMPQVTVSIGVAEYEPGDCTDSLFRRADAAMYVAKNSGRNRVFVKSNAKTSEYTSSCPFQMLFSDSDSRIETVSPLSGLLHASIFHEELSRRIYETNRYSVPLSILRLQFNFRGEQEAEFIDTVKAMADTLRFFLRKSDVACLYSSDEFFVMMPYTDQERANSVAQRLGEALRIERSVELSIRARTVRAGDGIDESLALLRGTDVPGANVESVLVEA